MIHADAEELSGRYFTFGNYVVNMTKVQDNDSRRGIDLSAL